MRFYGRGVRSVSSVGLLSVVLLLATACSSQASIESSVEAGSNSIETPAEAGSNSIETPAEADSGSGVSVQPQFEEAPSPADAVPVLEFLGDVAAVAAPWTTVIFDSTAGLLTLADGAKVEVPAGAFSAPTQVNAVVIDLLTGEYLENPPEARVYALATEADVELGEPVVLEVRKAGESVIVLQRVDGEWAVVEVPAGPTTRVEITHFSEVATAVIDRPGCSPSGTASDNNQLWGDWFIVQDARAIGDNLVAIEGWSPMCPAGTSHNSGVGSEASGQPATPTPTPDAPPAITPVPTVAVPATSTPVPTVAVPAAITPVPTVAPAATVPPAPTTAPCETGYTRNSSGVCVTPISGCRYPELDFSGRDAGCIFRVECAPPEAGYTVKGNNQCIYVAPGSVTCPTGYILDSFGQCVMLVEG